MDGTLLLVQHLSTCVLGLVIPNPLAVVYTLHSRGLTIPSVSFPRWPATLRMRTRVTCLPKLSRDFMIYIHVLERSQISPSVGRVNPQKHSVNKVFAGGVLTRRESGRLAYLGHSEG